MFKTPWNPGKKAAYAVTALLILLAVGFCTTARSAEPPHVQMAVGSTVVRGTTPAVSVNVVYPGRVGDASYEFGATFIGESSFRDVLQRNNFALHAGIVDGFGRFDVGLGVAYLQNTDEYNGSNLNFQLLLGYRFKSLPLTVRLQHFSNGSTKMPNRGRDMLLFFYRF
jgi:hypothetical protein